MVRELMHDPIFLAGKSEVATKEDWQVANDLLETLIAHKESCVGMAANMIGVRNTMPLIEDIKPYMYYVSGSNVSSKEEILFDGSTKQHYFEINGEKKYAGVILPPQCESIKDYHRITCENSKYLAK